MVLAAVGDAVGYKNGRWEFCHNTTTIYKDFVDITGGKDWS